ncbi:MAG: hypothetical protein NZ748_01380 [Candidatus Marinimicrobia bacterium]|nr:hypothetical protein [Candidatus Neomarinimicrobiota bacterium]
MKNNIRQLIQLAQAGDSKAFHQLVALHDDKIMTLAFQLTQKQRRNHQRGLHPWKDICPNQRWIR